MGEMETLGGMRRILGRIQKKEGRETQDETGRVGKAVSDQVSGAKAGRC